MRGPLRRWGALVFSLALLLSLWPAAQVYAAGPQETIPLQVVYIPIDDRPFHDQRMRLMADSLEIQLVMPDSSLYDTKLDGQASGTGQYGDRGALISWLKKQENKYDIFIISLDQLLSGGLMNSRCMEEMERIYVPGSGYMTEYDVIDYLSGLCQRKEVYIVDSVLRLACSNGFGGYTLSDYNATHAYGLLPRFVLGGSALTVDNIIRYYRSTGTVENAALIDRYLSVRERKLRLTDYAVRTLANRENVHFLLGVDDSSGGNNIQSNEISYFEQFLGENDLIFSAVDGLGQAALAKIYSLRYPEAPIRTSVAYFGGSPDDISVFNFLSTQTMLEQQIPYYGGVMVLEEPDISVLVVSSPEDQTERDRAFLRAVSCINENEAAGIPTILIDLTDSGQSQLRQLLVDNVHLGAILAYSGSYECPVQVTMAISQGMARYQSLLEDLPQSAHNSHLSNLLSAFLKELYKTGQAKTDVTQYLTGAGMDTNNFGTAWTSRRVRAASTLTASLQEAAEPLLENFNSSNVLLSRQPRQTAAITGASLGQCGFPWYRTFEISCQVSCTLGGEPYVYTCLPACLSGTGDGLFSPETSLTRNQAAKLLVSLSGGETSDDQDCPFADVPAWARSYVASAYIRGYVRGYDGNVFRGARAMTRAEFAALLSQYIQSEGIDLPAGEPVEFTDLPIDSGLWYTEPIYRMAEAGLLTGYEDGCFLPEQPITRGEAVIALFALFRRDGDLPEGLLEAPLYADVSTDHPAFRAIQAFSITRFRNS